MVKRKLILFFTFFTINILVVTATTNSSQFNNNSYNQLETRSDPSTGLTFNYSDSAADVELIDHRIDDYTETNGFDIKSISSELMGDRLWLNMSIYDNVQDDMDIYYKLKAADAEVILYKGDGEILYSKGSENLVTYTQDTITANLELSKLNYGTFSISGLVYWEDNNETLGNYLISDSVSADQPNELNELELIYNDSKDDVKITYTLYSYVNDTAEVDIISTQVKDEAGFITAKVAFAGTLIITDKYQYTVSLGNAMFELIGDKGTVKYANVPLETVNYKVSDRSISVSFDKQNLFYPPNHFEVTSFYQDTESRTYDDRHGDELPNYLFNNEEYFDLTVTMFEKNQIIMTLHSDLNPTHSQNIRSLADELGNDNGIVEETESAELIKQLELDYTHEDFFEFYPIVESIPGVPTFRFEFKNLLGDVSASTSVEQAVIVNWNFTMVEKDQHNITFRFLSKESLHQVGDSYIFDFSYETVQFNFSFESTGWYIISESTFPNYLETYLGPSNQGLTFPPFHFYVFKNLYPPQQFGFTVELNETAIDDGDSNGDEKPKKDEEDKGFLPGFEVFMILISICGIMVYFRVKKY